MCDEYGHILSLFVSSVGLDCYLALLDLSSRDWAVCLTRGIGKKVREKWACV